MHSHEGGPYLNSDMQEENESTFLKNSASLRSKKIIHQFLAPVALPGGKTWF